MLIDLILSLLLILLVIIIILKYVTITISDVDQKYLINKCGMQKPLFSFNNIPNGILSKQENILNGKMNLQSQTEDYNNQFYLSY